MQPIRVLQVFTVLNRGGAEANIMNYYRNIDRSKIQFDFLVHREEEGHFEKEIVKLGGRIFRLPAIDPRKITTYKKAVKVFFDSHPEYHIIHGQLSELGVFIYEEAKRRNVPVIIAHAHSSSMDWDMKSFFRLWWKKRMMASVNTYFACGSNAVDYLYGSNFSRPAYIMNNAVDSSRFQFDSELRKSLRFEMDMGNRKSIVSVARFEKAKNHIFLVTVFAEILKLNLNYHLYLVGDGQLKTNILKKIEELNISDHVTFCGVRGDVNSLLQAMDVFLFPSLHEGLGVAFIEAQASGIKCVISDGIPDEAILVHENVKVIPLNKSATQWAKEIVDFADYSRKDTSDTIKQKGYDIAENVRLLENKYLELLQQKR